MSRFRLKSLNDHRAKAIILLTIAVVLLLMLPLRNQTNGDDFAYGQSVRHFVQTGEIKVSEWSAPTLIFPIIWGGFFSKVLGFSFSTLHLSVIVMLPILGIFIYKLLRVNEVEPDKSLFLTLFFLSIPWIFQLSYTFRTEIIFLVLEVISLYYYFHGIKRADTLSLLLGSVFASLAFLTRQTGLILAAAAAIAQLFGSKNNIYQRLKNTLFILAVPILTSIIYFIWLSNPANATINQFFIENDLQHKITTLVSFSIPFAEKLKLLNVFFERAFIFGAQVLGLFSPIIIFLAIFNLNKLTQIFKKTKLSFLLITSTAIVYGILYIFRKDFGQTVPTALYRYEFLFPVHWENIWKFLVGFTIPVNFAIILSFFSEKRALSRQGLFLIISFLLIFISTITTIFSWSTYIIPFLPFF